MFLKPDYIVEKLEDIDFNALLGKGKRVLLFDLDSTLMPSKSGQYLPKTTYLLNQLKKYFIIAVISNNKNDEYINNVRMISKFDIISHAGKPSPRAMQVYLQSINREPKEAVVIGDRPLTDILAGYLLGATTILTDSITKDTESKLTRFVRKLERLVIKKPK